MGGAASQHKRPGGRFFLRAPPARQNVIVKTMSSAAAMAVRKESSS